MSTLPFSSTCRFKRLSKAMDPAAKKRRLEELMGGADGGGIAGAAPPAAPPAPPSRDAYVVNANEAVFFRLVTCPEDMDSAPSFNPEFTHQVFREDETIWGYRELEARGAARGAALTLQTRSPC